MAGLIDGACRIMAAGIAIMLLLGVALVLGARLYLSRAAEDRLTPGEDVAIAALRGPLPPNAALACPPGYCAVAEALPSPVFAVPVDRLVEHWKEAIAGEPFLAAAAADPAGRRLVYIQRSALFRFPDIVIAEFVALDGGRSSLTLYSRARYGRYDFGVNRRRIERWPSRLQQIAGASS